MKNPFLKLFLFVTVILNLNQLKADHFTGGDLSYKCLGNNQFEFTLVVYNELSAQNQSSSIPYYELSYFSKSLDIGIKILEKKVFKLNSVGFGVEIPLYCPAQLASNPNLRRVAKYTYKGTVVLPKAAPDWTFVFNETARSKFITTATTNLSTDYIVEAKINTLLASCNSSPQFNPNNHSIVNGYINKTTQANFGGVDPDGDEIRYSFKNPKGQLEENIVYKSGYTANSFIKNKAGITIDGTGVVRFEASQINEVGITDVLMEEYRNGQLIASITRGVQVTTKSTDNEAPELSGWNDADFKKLNSTSLTFCENDVSNIGDYSIAARDSNSEDKVSFNVFPETYLSWFVTSGYKYELNKTFTPLDVGTHKFTVTVVDDHCPETRSSEKEYIIIVKAKPSVSIAKDYIINCNNPKLLEPQISIPADYNYKWVRWAEVLKNPLLPDLDTIYTDFIYSDKATYAPPIAQKTGLIITDKFGCADSTLVQSFDSLFSDFTIQNFCFNSANPVTTIVSDISRSSEYSIVSWNWKVMPDDKTYSSQNFNHIFTTAGVKNVTLEVVNSAGCTKTSEQSINVCEPQKADFISTKQLCTGDPKVELQDVSNYKQGCTTGVHAPGERVWYFADGTPPIRNGSDTVSHEYKTPGVYDVVLETKTTGGCVAKDTMKLTVGQRPKVEILQGDSVAFVCGRLDTNLVAVITAQGTGKISYSWVSGTLKTPFTPIFSSDSIVKVSSVQPYAIYIKDEGGCTDSATTVLYNPVKADFSYLPVCNQNDSLKLISKSKSNVGFKEWKWTTTNFTKTDSVSYFKTATPNAYDINLEVTDSNGCKGIISKKINYLFVQNTFNLEKDSIQICATDNVDAFSFTPQLGFSNINETSWYIGVGDTSKVQPGYKGLKFPKEGDYNVYHKVIYNRDDSSGVYCVRDTIVPVNVKPEFKVDVFYNRLCLYDSGYFNIERITGDLNVPIVKTQWFITNSSASIKDTMNVKSFNYYFNKGGYYNITVTAQDGLGCISKNDASNNVSSRLPRPELEFLSTKICANELGKFNTKVDQTKIEIENITDYYLIANNDTIVKGKGNPRSFSIDYLFNKTHFNTVTYYLEDKKVSPFASHDSLRKSCRASVSIDFELIDLPFLDVTADTLCPKETVSILNLSKPTEYSGPIKEYYVLENNKYVKYPSNQKDWKKQFEIGGYQIFELVAVTDSGCTDTLRKPLYVKPGPKADFMLNERFPEAFTPLNLLDISKASVGLANDTAQLVASFYDLGDGTTSIDYNVQHTFNEVKTYPVLHWVENSYMCRDTIIKSLDMKPYLDVPNAFSPNKDGTNDQLGLIYKSILELYDYKIFNRWGQVVFDGHEDLDAFWDGTLNGVDQEVGVYIIHVKALGTYNTNFEFKKNITLIR